MPGSALAAQRLLTVILIAGGGLPVLRDRRWREPGTDGAVSRSAVHRLLHALEVAAANGVGQCVRGIAAPLRVASQGLEHGG